MPNSAAATVAAAAASPVVDRIRLRVSATGGGSGATERDPVMPTSFGRDLW
jgi:hypothetical protein